MSTVDQYVIDITVKGDDKVKQLQKDFDGFDRWKQLAVNLEVNGGKNVEDAINSVKKLERSIDTLHSQFGRLKQATAGVAVGFAALASGALNAADEMSDLAAATGMSIGNIAEFQASLVSAGGKADDASKMITKFFDVVDQAAEGSAQAQSKLQKLGITLEDIRTSSEKELLDKSIESLSKMEAGSARTALAMDIFGKSIRSLDPAKLKEALDSGDFGKLKEDAEKAAAAADALQRAFINMQNAMINVLGKTMAALEPFIGKMDDIGKSSAGLEKLITAVGIAIVVAFGAAITTQLLKFAIAVYEIGKWIKLASVAQAGFLALSGPKGWAILAGSVVAAGAAVYGLSKAWDAASSSIDKYNTLNDPASFSNSGENYGHEGMRGTPSKPKGRPVQTYTDEEMKSRAEAAKAAAETTKSMREQNDAALQYQQILNGTLGMEKVDADLKLNKAKMQQDIATKTADYERQIALEKAKGRESNPLIIKELEKQRDLTIEQTTQMEKLTSQRIIDLDNVTKTVKIMERIRDNNIERFTLQQEESRLALLKVGLVGQELESATKLLDIEQKRDALINTAKANYQAKVDSGTATSEDREKMNNDIAMAEESAQARTRIHNTELERKKALNNSYEQGVALAMENFKKMSDPAQIASNSMTAIFNDMNNALNNFVNTGKLNFGDLAKSIIRDLIKIQLQAQMTKMLAGGSGLISTGIGALTSMLGFADGGEPPVNKPSIVGERGPEIFVPKSAGTIIPNHALGGQPAGDTITNNNYAINISAVDAGGVAKLFHDNRQIMFGAVQRAGREMR